MMKINLWRLGHQVMWTIQFIFWLAIAIFVLGIIALTFSVFLWVLVGFSLMCAFVECWQRLHAWLRVRAKEKELADRC